jgi:hypothetical protein
MPKLFLNPSLDEGAKATAMKFRAGNFAQRESKFTQSYPAKVK